MITVYIYCFVLPYLCVNENESDAKPLEFTVAVFFSRLGVDVVAV